MFDQTGIVADLTEHTTAQKDKYWCDQLAVLEQPVTLRECLRQNKLLMNYL